MVDWGKREAVKVACLDVRHQRDSSGDTGHGEYDGHRQLEGLVIDSGSLFDETLQRPDGDKEEEHREDQGGDDSLQVSWDGPQRSLGNRHDIPVEARLFGVDLPPVCNATTHSRLPQQ